MEELGNENTELLLVPIGGFPVTCLMCNLKFLKNFFFFLEDWQSNVREKLKW